MQLSPNTKSEKMFGIISVNGFNSEYSTSYIIGVWSEALLNSGIHLLLHGT